MKHINKITLSALALPIAVLPAITLTVSCNKPETVVTNFDIDDKGLVTIKDKTLTQVTIPTYVNEKLVQGVATNGFKESKVEIVTFESPEFITTIGDNAFAGCTGIKSFTLPKNVTSLGSSAFSGCTGLQTFDFQNGCKLQTLKERTFENTDLFDITIPSSIVTMEKNLFAHSGATRFKKVFFQTKTGWKQNDTPIAEGEFAGPDNCADHFLTFNSTSANNWGYTGIVRTVKQATIDYSKLPETWVVSSKKESIDEAHSNNTISFGVKAPTDKGGKFVIWVTTESAYTLIQEEYDISDGAYPTNCYLTISDWTYINTGDKLYVRAMKKVS